MSVSTLLAGLTVITSLSVSCLATGSWFGTVTMPVLRVYGGTTFEDMRQYEIWRFATAQMIHATQAHMLFNALCLLLLGNLLEHRVGSMRVFLVWLFAGGAATFISPIMVEAPWNVGTGASQANFALAGCMSILALRGSQNRKLAWVMVGLVVIPGLILDLVFGGYPKPGHVLGFVLGAMFGAGFLKARISRSRIW